MILLVLGAALAGNLSRVISQQLLQSTTRGKLHQQIDASAENYLADVRFETTSGTSIVQISIINREGALFTDAGFGNSE
jgi:hypothetical protein